MRTATTGSSSPADQRRHPRALCSELVSISYRDQAGRKVAETGLIEDVGRNGFRVSISLPVSPGREVYFDAPGFAGFARVRYCELSEASYAWGLEFPIGFEWDAAVWNPQHLLELPLRDREC